MSAPALTVGRLTATLHTDDDAVGPDHVSRVLAAVAADELASALARHHLPRGYWCLRRLDVRVTLDLGQHDASLARSWADVLAGAVVAAVRPSGSVHDPWSAVHYAHELDALADALSGLARGSVGNLWAWRQVGVLDPGDPAPAGAAALTALRRRPGLALGAVVRTVRSCGLPALDRLLGDAGWVELADLVWSAASGESLEAAPTDATGPGAGTGSPWYPAARRAVAASALGGAMIRTRMSPSGSTLAAWAVLVAVHTDPSLPRRTGSRHLLGAIREELAGALHPPVGPRPAESLTGGPGEDAQGPTARITHSPSGRPGDRAHPGYRVVAAPPVTAGPTDVPPTVLAPPVLRPAPGPGMGSGADQGPDRDRAGRGGLADTEGLTALPTAPISAPPRESAPAGGGHAAGADDPEPSDGEPPGAPTDWAGLPFLLATAAAAGLPGVAVEAAELAARPLPWILHAASRALAGPAPGGPEPDDPGLLVLVGLDSSRAAVVLGAPGATAHEHAAVEVIAARWLEVTASRLSAADEPGDRPTVTPTGRTEAARQVVLPVLRRPGLVRADPGWLEVHLPLAGVDPVVRRAGLDLDPGWVPWLGAVVRYVYV